MCLVPPRTISTPRKRDTVSVDRDPDPYSWFVFSAKCGCLIMDFIYRVTKISVLVLRKTESYAAMYRICTNENILDRRFKFTKLL